MSFDEYKAISQPIEEFQLNYQFVDQLFPDVAPIQPGICLTQYLNGPAKWAMVQPSKTMKREAVISPFLFETARLSSLPSMVFACPYFDANPKLFGYPDYLVGRGQIPEIIQAPILAVVEAKKDDFAEGAGQCVTIMVAIREFNAAKSPVTSNPVFGCVTNGAEWFFYRLDGSTLIRHEPTVYLNQPDLILGILVAITSGTA